MHDPNKSRRFSARDALVCVGVCVALLVVLSGQSVRKQGELMSHGWERDLVLTFGKPAGWVADQLPFSKPARKLTASLHPNDNLGSGSGFDAIDKRAGGGVARVTADAFDPAALGARARPVGPLKTLLVTGDSMSQGLDAELGRRFAAAGGGVKTVRDAHVGTGISETDLVDWGKLAKQQERKQQPQAVVMFLGANEGFPMRGFNCCGPNWAAEYATRARLMMDTYRARGGARVYWLLLPAPRDPARQKISRAVNQALVVAAQPFRAQVRILDMSALFTPGGKFRSSMRVGGRDKIVRKPDGIHLNDQGATLAADVVMAAIKRDFNGP
jgi:lysophospholipase L1-like esterase